MLSGELVLLWYLLMFAEELSPAPQIDRTLVKLLAYVSRNDPVGYQSEIYSPATARTRRCAGVVASFMNQL